MEIRKEIRESILEVVNTTLSRLGVNECVKEVDKMNSNRYDFCSAPVRQTPMMFKELVVEGSMQAFESKNFPEYNLDDEYDNVVLVSLRYTYKHFEGGRNGCNIGNIVFAASRKHVYKIKGIEI